MVPKKLVYSGNFFLEHERVYTRLLGRPEYGLILGLLNQTEGELLSRD